MTLLWCLTAASLLAAAIAWRTARRAARRLEQLSHMYWELRYQHGELRVEVQRLSGGVVPPAATPPASEQPADAFVPLASLKR